MSQQTLFQMERETRLTCIANGEQSESVASDQLIVVAPGAFLEDLVDEIEACHTGDVPLQFGKDQQFPVLKLKSKNAKTFLKKIIIISNI